MENILVIAYGNPLRCDDGIAWQAAEEILRAIPSAQVICVHQLTPELAESASRADLVIFMDAATNGEPGSVACHPVTVGPSELPFSHHLTPPEVLALAAQLYEAHPHGFLVSINGQQFEHGETYSPEAAHAFPKIVAKVTDLVSRLLHTSTVSNRAIVVG